MTERSVGIQYLKRISRPFKGEEYGFIHHEPTFHDHPAHRRRLIARRLWHGWSDTRRQQDPRVIAAGTIIALVPIIIVFAAAQRVFFKGVEAGGIKA